MPSLTGKFIEATLGTSVRRAENDSQQPSVVPKLSTNVKALTGIIVVLAIVVLGLVGWKLWSWRKKKAAAKNTVDLAPETEKRTWTSNTTESRNDVEKGNNYTHPAFEHENAGWVPQVPVSYRVANPSASTLSTPQSEKFKKPEKLFLASARSTVSPPPSYKVEINTPEPSTGSSSSHFPVAPPPALTRLAVSNSFLSPQNHQTLGQSAFSPLTPTPRTASFNIPPPGTPANPAEPTPQMMTVVTTFTPSSHDELSVNVGEQLLLIQEYEDTWCLVERPGNGKPIRGVVPRFCLQERGKIIPVNSAI